MYHCHMLQHEDDGLMGQFIVEGEEGCEEERPEATNHPPAFNA